MWIFFPSTEWTKREAVGYLGVNHDSTCGISVSGNDAADIFALHRTIGINDGDGPGGGLLAGA